MLLRWRPDVLLLTHAVAGPGVGQERRVRPVLEQLGLGDRVTSLGVSETDSYQRALAGDVGYHLALGRRVGDWLLGARPDAVLGDAFESYNFQHDVARLLIDHAVGECRRRGRVVENYEFPLACRPDRAGAGVLYATFPTGPFHTLRLTREELAVKARLAAEAARLDPVVAEVMPLFPALDREPYRAVPDARDYSRPPAGLARHYDELALREVAAGRHARPIRFDRHFLPLVEALGRGRRRAAG
jgi:hypothetical protein